MQIITILNLSFLNSKPFCLLWGRNTIYKQLSDWSQREIVMWKKLKIYFKNILHLIYLMNKT